MKQIHVFSRVVFENWKPGEPYALVSFRDEFLPPANAPGTCSARLDVVCYDNDGTGGTSLPSLSSTQAQQIADFVRPLAQGTTLVCQCEAGVGRSLATAAAVARHKGFRGWEDLLRRGTHNRKVYQAVCKEFNLEVPAEPLVAIACRIKYPADRLQLFVNSLKRQRYDNWRCVFVSDGPGLSLPDRLRDELADGTNFKLVMTEERRGLWGHPYRQLGLDECLAFAPTYVGLQNDDNYLVPGFFERMVITAQQQNAELVICDMLHSYCGWAVTPGQKGGVSYELANWLASASLVRRVPWEGTDFLADRRYVTALVAKANRVAHEPKPLLVKN